MKLSNLISGGFRSRKLQFSLFALLLVFLGGLITSLSIITQDVYKIMVGGIETISGLYLAGNIGSKWVNTKVPTKPEDKPEDQ